MKRTGSWFLLACICSNFHGFSQAPWEEEAWSANKKFSVEISNQPEVLLSIFKRDGEKKSLFWARRLKVDDDDRFPEFERRILTADGNMVILRREYIHGEESAIRLVTKEREVTFSTEDILDAAEEAGNDIEELHGDDDGQIFDLLMDSDTPGYYGL